MLGRLYLLGIAIISIVASVYFFDWDGERYIEQKVRQTVLQLTNNGKDAEHELELLLSESNPDCVAAKGYWELLDYLDVELSSETLYQVRRVVGQKQSNCEHRNSLFHQDQFPDHIETLVQEAVKFVEKDLNFQINPEFLESATSESFQRCIKSLFNTPLKTFMSSECLSSLLNTLSASGIQQAECLDCEPPNYGAAGLSAAVIAVDLGAFAVAGPEGPVLSSQGTRLLLGLSEKNPFKDGDLAGVLSKLGNEALAKDKARDVMTSVLGYTDETNGQESYFRRIRNDITEYVDAFMQAELFEAISDFNKTTEKVGLRRSFDMLRYIHSEKDFENQHKLASLHGNKANVMLKFADGDESLLLPKKGIDMTVWQNQVAAALMLLGMICFAVIIERLR